MKIGSWGDLVFEAGAGKILSFPALSRSGSARIEKHEVAGARPIVEFVGPGEDNVSFELYLSRALGVDPDAEIKKLRSAMDAGMRYPLILGDELVGGSAAQWMIADLSEESEKDNRGYTIKSRVSVSMTLAPDPPNIVANAGKVAKKGVSRRRVTS